MTTYSFHNTFPTLTPLGLRLFHWFRTLWESDFRRKRISWTQFRQRRLTWKGFLSFDANARCRTYLYVAALILALAGRSIHPMLTRMACQAIGNASLPRIIWTTCHSEQTLDIQAMRQAIVHRYDLNQDNRLEGRELSSFERQTGLASKDLKLPPSVTGYDKFLAACLVNHLLPKRITSRVANAYALSPHELGKALRRQSFQKGQEEYSKANAAMWTDVNSCLKQTAVKPSDYLRLSTWQRGTAAFWSSLYGLFVGGSNAVIWWLGKRP